MIWLEKLSFGVLRVITPVGPRYIRPTLLQRIYLLWIFRHFEMLPMQVLSVRQQKWIDRLCSQHRFVALPRSTGMEDAPILGTMEWRPRIDGNELPPARPSSGVPAPVPSLVERRVRHRF